MADTKTEQLGLRITPLAKTLLRKAAAREHRSASNMVEHLILDYCEKHHLTVDDTDLSTDDSKDSL